MIKNKMKKISLSVVATLGLLVPSFTNVSAADDDITLDLQTKSNVDVILSIGNTSRDLSTFESSLRSKLSQIGVDTSKVRIEAVETVSQNLQNSFAWTQHVSSSVGSISIQNNGTRIQMYGNPTNPGFNKIFTNVVDTGIKSQDMSFTYSINYGDSFDAAGILLNTQVTNNVLNGYALVLPKSTNGSPAYVYKLNNWSSSSNEEIYIGGWGASGTVNSKATLVGTINMGSSGSFTVRTEKDKLTVLNKNTGATLGSVTLPTHYGWGFGFMADHYSHGCDIIGQFSLTNVELAQTNAKEFTEVIRIPEWRTNSERVMVHIDEKTVPNFDDAIALGEIIPRLSNENINFLAYGNSVNRTQFEKVIGMNNSRGAFYDTSTNTSYNSALDNTAAYIKRLIEQTGTGGQYVLVGKPIEVNVNPASLKTNTANAQYPQGRWKIDHDYNYFDNSLGQANWANQYQNNLVMSFEKPGRYEVSFGNTHPEPRYIYAHRQPISNFSVSFSGTSGTIPLYYNDRSYDPDREFSADKGVKAREWKWRTTTSSTWNNGQLTSIQAGDNYIVQLRVMDEYGVWSNAVQKYVTTNASTSIVPIADFDLNTYEITRYETLKYDDYSYTPNGLPITTKSWKVYNSVGTLVYSNSTPLTSFAGRDLGKYKITLQVTNSSGVVSEEFARYIDVVRDSAAPEAIINPTMKEWTNLNYSIGVTINDVGGSGFKNQQYALTNSQTFPTSGLSALSTSNTLNVPVTNDGIYYLHLRMTDNEGNTDTRTSGPYKLDKTNPNTPVVNLSKTTWTGPVVTFTITDKGDGSGSGVQTLQYRIAGGTWKNHTAGSTVSIPENLAGKVLVEARAIDLVGNISGLGSATALIDDKDPVINSVTVETVGNKQQLVVDAVDNESGIKNPGYQYYQKIVGKDSSFNIINGGFVSSNKQDLPQDLSATKYLYKAEVEDGNKHKVISNEVAYVSSPIITKAEVKDGDFDNTFTFDFKNKIGTDVSIKVIREGEVVALLDNNESKFVDAGLDYERDYNYEFVAVTMFNGKEVSSLATPVKITIGKPTLEVSLDSNEYFNTTFSDDFKVTGNVVYRKGGAVSVKLVKDGNVIDTKVVNVLPYAKTQWSVGGIQTGKAKTGYTIEFDLVGFENMKVYKREYKVSVSRINPSIKVITDFTRYKK